MTDKSNGELQTQIQYLLVEQLAAGEERRILLAREKSAREAAEQSQKRITMILESISDAFFAVDRQERIIYVNQKAEALFRKTRAELTGRYVWDQMVGSGGTRLYTEYQKALSKNLSVHFQEFYAPLGIWYEVHIYPSEDGCSFCFHEITERKRSEEALKESQEYAKNLIDCSLDMIIAVDKNRNITAFNKAAQEAFGYCPEEVLGKNVGILYAEPEQGSKLHAKTLKEGRCVQEIMNVRKNGELFPCLLSASPLRSARGEAIGVMAVSRDITERKKVEEQLRAASLYARSLIEASLDPLVTISPDGKISDVNQATEQVTGLSRERLIGSDFSDYFSESDKAREGYQRAMSQGWVKDYPLSIRHMTGKTTDVLCNARV
jgi:PAS domain S-box-containing protein